MKILLVIMKYDYGDSTRGHSYEFNNYYQSLVEFGYEVNLFDFMSIEKTHGRTKMNQLLLQTAEKFKPDIAVFHLYTNQFDVSTIKTLGTITKTLSIFHDDTWRKDFTQHWIQYFDYFTTADYFSYMDYKSNGYDNALFFPYGCNEKIYHHLDLTKIYNVSFIGRWHPYRQWIVNRIRKANVNIHVSGPGWPGGMLDHGEMVKLICQSKINLNLSNSSSWDTRYLFSSPSAVIDKVRSKKTVEQIKGRHFEINACGGFQLSNYVGGIEKHFKIGREISVYESPDDLIEKIKFYSNQNEIREEIAKAGYARAITDHTFSIRFHTIFQIINHGFTHE